MNPAPSSLPNVDANELDELGRLVLDTSAERAELIDMQGRLREINARGRRLLALDGRDVQLGASWSSLWSPSSLPAVEDALTRASQGLATQFEAQCAGSQRRWSIAARPLRDPRGRPARVLAIVRELHAHSLKSALLSEELLRLALREASLGTWQWDLQAGHLDWSDRSFAMFGLEPRPNLTLADFEQAVDPRDRALVQETIARAVRDRTDHAVEFRVVWPDKSVHWVSSRAHPVYDAHGTPTHIEGVALDITAQRQAERDLRDRELRFRQLADAIPHLVWRLGLDGQHTYVNQRWVEFTGRNAVGFDQWNEIVHPDDLPRALKIWSSFASGESALQTCRLRRHDGVYQWFACRVVPLLDDEGRVSEIIGTATDIEQLKQADDALRESRMRLDMALRAAGMGTWSWHLDSDLIHVDGSLAQLLGFPELENSALEIERWLDLVHADDAGAVRAAVARSREHGADLDVECRLRRGDGLWICVAAKGRLERAVAGGRPQMFGACVDVTQHKRLEDELRQAQKMEAIGQLAGGVAHDFNNLLMVILGQASLISIAGNVPDSVEQAVREIEAAAERAASLTSQLLAFGRRQTMQRRDVDMNEIVASAGQMLRRLIGENVVLRVEAAATALRLRADPNMLVQVLLNLAVNARDAMPAGGQLTLRASREVLDERSAERLPEGRPGSWACLSISDTGEGISEDVLPHIFEPFFTTKEAGKGTGLGLSTVYGIVKQHQGFVAVDSSKGGGATFKVFLPLPQADAVGASLAGQAQALHGWKELVLLVEDDPAVRAAMSSILEQHNYRLLVADDGVQALELFAARGSEIALLLSDVVLPRGLSGVDLAQRLRGKNPRLQVILCSGYSADKIEQGMDDLRGMLFLQKPYRVELLLSSMRSLLDQERAAHEPRLAQS